MTDGRAVSLIIDRQRCHTCSDYELCVKALSLADQGLREGLAHPLAEDYTHRPLPLRGVLPVCDRRDGDAAGI